MTWDTWCVVCRVTVGVVITVTFVVDAYWAAKS